MTPAVLMLYGPYAQHPWREDMFHRPDMIQAALKKLDFGMDVAVVTHAPTGKDEAPKVRIAKNPVYDQQNGTLLEADFCPGTIADYPIVVDNWVHNFRDEVLQEDGTLQMTAHGVGLPPRRLWNHKNIQTFGNRKDLMDRLIMRHGVGIPTYSATDYVQFADEEGGGIELIYKPQGGALGAGIEVFKNIKELQRALNGGRVATNGFIQPFLHNNQPVQGVLPFTRYDEKLLRTLNSKPDRPRDLRMYVITTTDQHGKLQTEAYPVIKVSEPNRKFLKFEQTIILDPACIGPGSYIHDKSVEMAQALCHEAGEDGEPIPQYYGVFDWLVDGDVNTPGDVRVVDGNCRRPGLPERPAPARDALQRAWVYSGKQVLDDEYVRGK